MNLPQLPLDLVWIAAILTTAIAAFTDARTERIPNWLTYPSLVLALAVRFALGSFPAVAVGLIGLLIAGGILLMLFLLGQGGGGDVKLFAALGAWLGASPACEVLFYSVTCACLYALVRLAWSGDVTRTLKNAGRLVANVFRSASSKKPIETTELKQVRLGPPTLVGILFAAFLQFGA